MNKSVDNIVFVVYNRGINNKRKEIMKESERLRLENDKLQAELEALLTKINARINGIKKDLA